MAADVAISNENVFHRRLLAKWLNEGFGS